MKEKGKSQPAGEHLQIITDMTCKSLGPYMPDFCEDIRHYPQVTDRPQNFLVVLETYDNRPLYTLVHRMADITENHAFFMHREYFVSHSYDAMQVIFLCVPYKEGTLIGLFTDVITHEAAGFGTNFRHKVGREKIQSIAKRRLTDVKAFIEAYQP